MRFIIIKDGTYNYDTVKDVIQSLVGNNIKTVNKNNNIVIYHSYNDEEEIRRMLLALEVELMTNMYAYLSNDSSDDRLDEELEIGLKLLEFIPHGVFNLKEALLHANNVKGKDKILSFILKYTGISEDFIRDFAKCDLNVSKASKEMFIHRNTMIYKLDKLKEISGFDLRCFKDAYILYMLVENK
ncbi:MAG: helix-turn-helix domain-containing protein [Acholeplasmatales bacterium]|nr:helix-turn-helix domain-containing protein [Acholeplasmatales bacterium]